MCQNSGLRCRLIAGYRDVIYMRALCVNRPSGQTPLPVSPRSNGSDEGAANDAGDSMTYFGLHWLRFGRDFLDYPARRLKFHKKYFGHAWTALTAGKRCSQVREIALSPAG